MRSRTNELPDRIPTDPTHLSPVLPQGRKRDIRDRSDLAGLDRDRQVRSAPLTTATPVVDAPGPVPVVFERGHPEAQGESTDVYKGNASAAQRGNGHDHPRRGCGAQV